MVCMGGYLHTAIRQIKFVWWWEILQHLDHLMTVRAVYLSILIFTISGRYLYFQVDLNGGLGSENRHWYRTDGTSAGTFRHWKQSYTRWTMRTLPQIYTAFYFVAEGPIKLLFCVEIGWKCCGNCSGTNKQWFYQMRPFDGDGWQLCFTSTEWTRIHPGWHTRAEQQEEQEWCWGMMNRMTL